MKKFTLLAIIGISAFFTACGDDSSSSPSSKELPASVKHIEDIGDIDCNAERKCAKILIEEFDDYMECDGSQWNTVIASVPSKVCPAEAPSENNDTSNN